MTYRNIKVDFEYLGTEYPGIAVDDRVEILLGESDFDGFPPFTVFKKAGATPPNINPGGIASMSKNAAPTSGYFVLDYVP